MLEKHEPKMCIQWLSSTALAMMPHTHTHPATRPSHCLSHSVRRQANAPKVIIAARERGLRAVEAGSPNRRGCQIATVASHSISLFAYQVPSEQSLRRVLGPKSCVVQWLLAVQLLFGLAAGPLAAVCYPWLREPLGRRLECVQCLNRNPSLTPRVSARDI